MVQQQKEDIQEAVEMINLYNQCLKKIDFLTEIKLIYGDLKIGEVIESLEYQANKFNNKFKSLVKKY